MKLKKKCAECPRKVVNLHRYKGNFLCWRCYKKKILLIGDIKHTPKYTLEEALNKVYKIHYNKSKKGDLRPRILVPQILIGYKVKLSLVPAQKGYTVKRDVKALSS